MQTENRSNVFLHLRNWWHWHESLDSPRLGLPNATNFFRMSRRVTARRSQSFNAEIAQQFDSVLAKYRQDWGDAGLRIITAEMSSDVNDSDRIRARRAGVNPGRYWQAWKETLDQLTWLCDVCGYDLREPPLG